MEKIKPNNGDGGERPPDDPREILHRAMLRARPSFKDFEGAPRYSEAELWKDKGWLAWKNAQIENNGEHSSSDVYARDMEPILVYILNDEKLFPTRESFSFWASEYDDKRNGTDAVFGVQNRKTKEGMAFSVDVTTDTLVSEVKEKFRKSFDVYQGKSYIKYCIHKDKRWREPNAPHFVLGMSPASQDKALSKIIITDGELKGRERDADSNFIVLSEIKEQISLHLAILSKKPKTDTVKQMIDNLGDLLPAVYSALSSTLGIKSSEYPSKKECEEAFQKKYSKKREELARFDDVYRNIINVAIQRARGKKAL